MSVFPNASSVVTSYKVALAAAKARMEQAAEGHRRLCEYIETRKSEGVDGWTALRAAKQAALPADFTVARAEYLAYVRSIAKAAIEAAVSPLTLDNAATTVLRIPLHKHGCCETGVSPLFKWGWHSTHNYFSSADFIIKGDSSHAALFDTLGLTDIVTALREELEPLGYTMEVGSHDWEKRESLQMFVCVPLTPSE